MSECPDNDEAVGLWEPSTAMRRCRADVARAFSVTPWAVVGPDRTDRLSTARRAAVWVLKARWPNLGLAQLGAMVSLGHHSTVLHALRRAEEMRAGDMVFHFMTQALAEQRLAPEPPPRLRAVKPRNDMQADDGDARRRSAGTDRLLAALRREHPERFGRTAAGSAATGERMMACG